MLNLDELNAHDIEQLRQIHARHYANEFAFPDFAGYVASFAVFEGDKVITGGGIRLIPEIVLMTDKDMSVLHRRWALMKALDYSQYVGRQLNTDILHAFVQDEKFARQLRKSGFHSPKGECLIIEVP